MAVFLRRVSKAHRRSRSIRLASNRNSSRPVFLSSAFRTSSVRLSVSTAFRTSSVRLSVSTAFRTSSVRLSVSTAFRTSSCLSSSKKSPRLRGRTPPTMPRAFAIKSLDLTLICTVSRIYGFTVFSKRLKSSSTNAINCWVCLPFGSYSMIDRLKEGLSSSFTALVRVD